MKEKLKRLISRLIKNQLVKGSAVLLAGSLIGNFGNYLYHLVVGRLLGPSDYGALESVISLVYLLGIPLQALSLVVIKTVSALREKGQANQVVPFYQYLHQKLTRYGFLGTIFLLAISPLMRNFLHLHSLLPVFTMIGYFFLAIFFALNISVLNAFLKFFQVSLIGAVQAFAKLGFAVLLIILGLSVAGAVGSFIGGTILALLISLFFLRKILKDGGQKTLPENFGRIFKQTIPFLVFTFSFTSLYTSDTILARHFLPAQEAGFYAGLAVLGKIVTFACGPIGLVMFPIISGRHAAGKAYQKLFIFSLGLVFSICLGITGVYLLLPELMVQLLFGQEFLAASPYLWLFAIFLSFYSLASLTSQFLLSISRQQSVWLPLIAAVAQILGIFLFHQNLVQIATLSLVICGLLFASLMISFGQIAKIPRRLNAVQPSN